MEDRKESVITNYESLVSTVVDEMEDLGGFSRRNRIDFFEEIYEETEFGDDFREIENLGENEASGSDWTFSEEEPNEFRIESNGNFSSACFDSLQKHQRFQSTNLDPVKELPNSGKNYGKSMIPVEVASLANCVQKQKMDKLSKLLITSRVYLRQVEMLRKCEPRIRSRRIRKMKQSDKKVQRLI